MQTYKAPEIFGNIKSLNTGEFESSENILIDFSGVDFIDYNMIKKLLELQKVAMLNNKKIIISNVSPDIKNVLDLTGFNKTFENLATNPLKRNL